MTTCLGKSCSLGLLRVPFLNCCQFMYLVISLLLFKSGIWDLIVSVPVHCLSFYFVMKLGCQWSHKGIHTVMTRVRVGPPRGILMTLIAPVEPPGDTVVTLG